jgi:hypothetical protein
MTIGFTRQLGAHASGVQLGIPGGVSVRSGSSGGGSLSPPIVSIAALSASKPEGNSGVTEFTFVVTRSSGIGTTYIDWACGYGDGQANAADFEGGILPSGTIYFADGETSHIIVASAQGDTDVESDESFTVMLFNPVNAVIGIGEAVGIILNDDEPQHTIGGDGYALFSARAVWDGSKSLIALQCIFPEDTNTSLYYLTYDTSFSVIRNAYAHPSLDEPVYTSRTPAIVYEDGSIKLIFDEKYLSISPTITNVSTNLYNDNGGDIGAVVADNVIFAQNVNTGKYAEYEFDPGNSSVNLLDDVFFNENYPSISGFRYSTGVLGAVVQFHWTSGSGASTFRYAEKIDDIWNVVSVPEIMEFGPGGSQGMAWNTIRGASWMEASPDSLDNLYVFIIYQDISSVPPPGAFHIQLSKRNTSGTWTTEFDFVPMNISGNTPFKGAAFALDSNDKAHISWGDINGIHYASNKTGSWVLQNDITNKPAGINCSCEDLIIDNSNNAHIFYIEDNRVLKHVSA